jgi:hypothetical protein
MRKVPRGFVAVVAVVALFGLAAVSAGSVATDTQSQSTIATDQNSTNYLSPPAPAGEEYERVSMDVSTAAAAAAQEIHNAHDAGTFERQLQSASEDRRSAVAQRQLEAVRDRLERLDRRQAELFAAYGSGEISTQALLRELIALETAVDAQTELRTRAESTANPSTALRVELETLEDVLSVDRPVIERLQGTLVGGDAPQTAYLQHADNALVLALVDGDDYYRQATLLDQRDPDGSDQFGDDLSPGGYSEAQQRLEALYPWAYNLPDLQIGGGDLSVYSRIYQLGLDHPQGELTAYLDGATKDVFHENQRLRLDTLPIERTVANSTESGSVTVETTRSTGAMRVTTEDAGGSAVERDVRIGEQVVGTTNEEGRLWTVQPAAEFELSVTMPDGGNVTVDWEPEG